MSFNINVKKVRAVVFDYDNTLVNETYWIKKRWEKTNDFVEKKYNLINYSKAFWKNFYSQDQTLKTNIVDKTLSDVDANISSVNEIVRFFKEVIVEERLIKHSLECLGHLKKNNYLIGLITNGKRLTHENRLKKANLFQLFDIILYGDKTPKPSTRPFIKCADELNIDLNNMVYVGDDYINDYLASQSAGCIPILFDCEKSFTSKYQCNKINSLKSLIKIF
jgi:putative hydrolase of the HAD superfamily